MIAVVIRIVIGFAMRAYFWILLAAFFSRSFFCTSLGMACEENHFNQLALLGAEEINALTNGHNLQVLAG